VEGEHARQHPEAGEDEGEHPELLRRGEARGRGRQLGETEAVAAGRRVGPEHARQHQRAAGEGIEHELHRAVLAVGRTPLRDEEILRHDRDLVEDEEHERVGAQEHAAHAADQREVEREELAGALRDVPGEQDAGRRREPGEHEQRQADAVGREVVADAELGNPGGVDQVLQPGRRHEAGRGVKGEPPDGQRGEQRHDPRGRRRARPSDQREEGAGEGHIDGAGQGVHE
jgi:hypothetical protein